MVAVLVVAATAAGARDHPWRPPACPTGAAPTPGAVAWWRLDPKIVDGRLGGQRLTLGTAGAARPRIVDLAPEAFAAGPFNGRVLVGEDDGRRSGLSLIDLSRGCSTAIGDSPDVIRRATLTPDGTAVVEFRVDRTSRTERGVFRRPLADPGRVTRLLGPIVADVRFGPTWTTEFAWSSDGRSLAVQSCGARACRTRVLDPATGDVRLVGDPGQGDLIGLAGRRLIVHGACGGIPCPIESVDVDRGDRVILHHEAAQATLITAANGRPLVVVEVGADGRQLRVMDPLGGGGRDLRPDPLGRRLVPEPARAGGAVAPAPGMVVLAAGGRPPASGPGSPIFRRLSDDATLALDEVIR